MSKYDRESIISEIENVFPPFRSKDLSLTNSAQGDEPLSVCKEFKDKLDWTVLSSDWLDRAPDGQSCALSFLSDEAVCFYIPAYIISDLKGELNIVDPMSQLTQGFDDLSLHKKISLEGDKTWTDFGRARWVHLNRQQVHAVVNYIEWRVASNDVDAASAGQALKNFWYPRLLDK